LAVESKAKWARCHALSAASSLLLPRNYSCFQSTITYQQARNFIAMHFWQFRPIQPTVLSTFNPELINPMNLSFSVSTSSLFIKLLIKYVKNIFRLFATEKKVKIFPLSRNQKPFLSCCNLVKE
jgi:hypothetical protein